MKDINNPLLQKVRSDIPGRFNEADILRRHWPRIINLLQGEILPPYEILIHPSSTCNLRCLWCIGSNLENDKIADNLINIDNMKKVIDGIINYKKTAIYKENGELKNKEFRVENVSFSGIVGEPLIAKKSTLYAMDQLSKNNFRVGMFTNGVLMDETTWDTLLNTAYVLVSVDAGKKETYSYMKYGGSSEGNNIFTKILKNIEGLANKRICSSSSNLDINVGFVINQYNYSEVYELAKILKNIGVHYFRIKTDISSTLNMNSEQLSMADELIAKVSNDLVDNNFNIVNIHNIYNNVEKKRSFSKCLIHALIGAIGSDGNLYPCNYHPRPGAVTYGNTIEKSFGEIWESKKESCIDKKLPEICPQVCDPFKNRANKLLNAVNEIYTNEGIERLTIYKDELLNINDKLLNQE